MSRLPTIGGDYDSWGTVLNDYLNETAGVAVLSSSPTVAATTLDLAVVPSGLKVGSVVAIDAFTTECELRSVTSVSGNTIGFTATRYAHASNDTLLVLQDYAVTPPMFGITDSSVDNWGPMQRLVNESAAVAVKAKYVAALVGAVWSVSKPICVPTSSQWDNIGLKTHASYGPVDDAGALCMVANRSWAFTAAASNNTFTVAAGHGMSSYSATNHTKIVFNNPYGETLPGGITAGKVYYIDTVPNGTTFTVSATSGGSVLDVTSDGTGWAWESIEQLSRVYWDNVRFDLTVADVHGVRASLQQPAYITNMRIEMEANASTRAYGAVVGGQIAYLTNVEINGVTNCTCLSLGGTGITVRGFNSNGGDIGIDVAAWQALIENPWTESMDTAGIKLSGGRAITITGPWMQGGPAPALIHDPSDGFPVPYEVGQIYMLSGSDHVILEDVLRSITLYSAATSAPNDGLIATDYQFTFPGWYSPGAASGSSWAYPPTFKIRFGISISNSFLGPTYKIRYVDQLINADSTAAGITLSLPAATSWFGHRFSIRHSTGGNTCTVDTVGTELIDGAASITVPVTHTIDVISDGTNWYTVADWTTTKQTYTATNVVTDRSYDADAVLIAELADVVGTLIADLRTRKLIA